MRNYWGSVLRQAVIEAAQFIGLSKERKDIGRSIGIFTVTLLVVWYIGGGEQMTEELRWGLATLIAIGVVYIPILLYKLFAIPPQKQKENEKEVVKAKGQVRALEVERIPSFEMQTATGKTHTRIQGNPVTWADLSIRNTSQSVELLNVSVQVTHCIHVLELQDSRGTYYLYDDQKWSPTNVYWSERNATPSQFSLSIPRGATRIVTLALRHREWMNIGFFNAPNHPAFYDAVRVEVEVSASNSAMLGKSYCLEYHPPARDEYELTEWEDWVATHRLVERPTQNRGDSQTE